MNFSFLNNFGLGANPPEHSITDTTDYAGQGIVAANVSGLLKLTGPAGIYYINPGYINDNFGAPDIISPFAASVKPLPLNGDGEVEQGTYYLDYKIKVAFQQMSRPIIGVDQGANSITVSGNYVDEITGSINQNIVGSTGNDAAYTLASVSLVGANTVVVFLNPPLASAIANGNFEYQANQYYSAPQQTLVYNIAEPCAKLEITSDCGCAKLTSRDVTEMGLWSVAQRTHTLNYPLGSGISPVISSSSLILINDLYTNTYVGLLSLDITYSPSTGFTITNTITAQKDHKVECDAGLCCIFSCMKAVFSKYVEYKANGSQAEAMRYQNIIIKMYGYWMLYSIAHNCGDTDEMAVQLAAIKNLINTECGDCGCNTDCNDGETSLVVPICGPNGGGGGQTWIYEVVACNGNNLITVTANVVNDTVTYTVCADEGQFTVLIEGVIASTNLGDLADVTITTVQDGQSLVWDSGTGQWVNQFIEYNTLNDVDVTTDPLQNGDMMIWDNVNQVWVNVRRDGILYNPETIVGTNADLNWKVLHTFPVPAGRLDADGDQLRWMSFIRMVPSFAAGNQILRVKHTVDGTIIPYSLLTVTGAETYLNTKKIVFYKVEFIITRVSNSEVSVRAVYHVNSGLPLNGFVSGSSEMDGISINGLDLDANPLTLQTEGKNENTALANSIKEIGFMIEKMSKI